MLARNISTYTFFNLLNGSIPFLILPFLTSQFTSESYGIVSMAQVLITMVIPMIILSFDGYIRVFYFKSDINQLPSVIFSGLTITLFTFGILLLLTFFIGDQITELIDVNNEVLYMVLIIVLLKAVPLVILALFHAKQEAFNYGLFMVGITLLNFIASLLLVYIWDLDWRGRLYGILFAEFTFTVIGLVYLMSKGYFKFSFRPERIKGILNYGLPLLPHGVSGYLLNVADRLILANIIGLGAVGMFAVGNQISMILLIFFTAINQGWSIKLFEFLKNDQSPVKTLKITLALGVLMVLAYVLLNLFTPIIYDLFIDEKFHSSKSIVRLIALGFLFRGIYFLFTNYLFYFEKTKILSIITFIVVMINLGLNYLLIPRLELLGAAYSAMISNFVLLLLTFLYSQIIYPLPWRKVFSTKK